jgi:hypothetical protein
MCPGFHVTPEHEARELLNLILLLERCLALPDATAAERAAWRADFADARRRLDDLLAPGRDSAILTRRLAAQAGDSAARAQEECV